MVAIDDVPLTGKDLRDVTDMLRGAPGTKVKVTFERDGVPTKLDAIIERKQVRLRDVPLATMIGPPSDGLAYVQVRSFAMNTKQEVVNALDKLQAATPEKKLRAVILDLRGNPGGASALLLLPRRCCCCCLCGSVLLDAGVRVGECAGCCSFGDCYAFFSFLAEALSGMISLALALCRSALSPSLPPPPPPRSLSHARTHTPYLSLSRRSLARRLRRPPVFSSWGRRSLRAKGHPDRRDARPRLDCERSRAPLAGVRAGIFLFPLAFAPSARDGRVERADRARWVLALMMGCSWVLCGDIMGVLSGVTSARDGRVERVDPARRVLPLTMYTCFVYRQDTRMFRLEDCSICAARLRRSC